MIKAAKHLESTSLTRGEDFSQAGHRSGPGSFLYFRRSRGRILRLNFIDYKTGRMGVLARPDLPSQDR